MEVYALIGPSGTGKSHQAMTVAHEQGIKVVIDDGLLIKEGCKMAGRSAKRETTTIAAVKRAIFHDGAHAQEVKACLAELQPAKILILGTSLHMIMRIVATLELPRPVQIIKIEEIATEKEMKLAREMRLNHGMHVIPVPTIELKADFPGYLLDPLKYFLKKKDESRQKMGEKSILRPKFSLMGKLFITEQVIVQIVTYYLRQISAITRLNKVFVNLEKEGVLLKLEVTARYQVFLPDVAVEIKEEVQKQVEYLTGLIVYQIDILFKSLDY